MPAFVPKTATELDAYGWRLRMVKRIESHLALGEMREAWRLVGWMRLVSDFDFDGTVSEADLMGAEVVGRLCKNGV